MADEPYLFIGDCDDFMRSDNPVFKTLGRYIAVHDETPANVGEYAKLFKGELCSHFKCVDGWEDYDFIESYGQILAVNKRLGSAEEWLNISTCGTTGKYILSSTVRPELRSLTFTLSTMRMHLSFISGMGSLHH